MNNFKLSTSFHIFVQTLKKLRPLERSLSGCLSRYLIPSGLFIFISTSITARALTLPPQTIQLIEKYQNLEHPPMAPQVSSTSEALKEKILLARGNEGGHGGDIYAQEFYILGKLIAERMKAHSSQIFYETGLRTQDFERAVLQKFRVLSADKEEVQLKGFEVEALNFNNPEAILISRDYWRQKNLVQKLKLVLHEYLGILGVERDTYSQTSKEILLNLILDLAKDLKANPAYEDLQVNLFYGVSKDFIPMSMDEICQTDSDSFKRTLTASQQQALSSCKINGNTECKIVTTILTPIISTYVVGQRYCEVLTLVK